MPRIMVVDASPLSQEVLKEAFEEAGFEVEVAAGCGPALRQASLRRPDVVVFDMALLRAEGPEMCRQIKYQSEPAPRVLIIGQRKDSDDKMRSFEYGADDFVGRPFDLAELVGKIRALAGSQGKSAAAASAPAKVFSFFSAKGGAGTTSICVNTAAALASLARDRGDVTVADLVLPVGSVGYMLNLGDRANIASITSDTAPPVNAESIRDYLCTRPRLGFSVLLGPADPAQAQRMSPNKILPVLNAVRSVSDYLLVDIGRNLSRISMPILSMSDRIVVVIAATRPSLYLSKVCLDYLAREGVPPYKITLVLNRPGVSVVADLTRSEVEGYLDRGLYTAVPYEDSKFTHAANEGVPLVQNDPECTSSMSILELAKHLLEVSQRTGGPLG